MDRANRYEFLEESEFGDDIFSVLETLETASDYSNTTTPASRDRGEESKISFEFQNSAYNSSLSAAFQESETEPEAAYPKCKKQKLNATAASASASASVSQSEEGQQKTSHITVERNRRKQMNEHLSVLRSLMPCFYVKRGDQASIIGGVINYIHELQQVLQSLEAKKQRKIYNDTILSPRPVSSPLSPRKPPLSPRLNLNPISPRTPQSSSPFKPLMYNLQMGYNLIGSPSLPSPVELSPCNSSNNDTINELVASSKSALAEVEVKFSGPNLLLKTVSHRIPGQALKIISTLEELALEILQVNINTIDERMVNSFTIKIGIECQLSAEELAHKIQQTFS